MRLSAIRVLSQALSPTVANIHTLLDESALANCADCHFMAVIAHFITSQSGSPARLAAVRLLCVLSYQA